MNQLPRALALFLFLATLVRLSAQTTAVSNLDQSVGLGLGVGKSSGFDFSHAFNFTTGASSLSFSSITFAISGATGSPSGFNLSLYSSVSTSGPSGLIASLAGSSAPTSIGSSYTYTPVGSLALSASTTYWVVATASTTASNSAFFIRGTSSDSEDAGGLSGWTIGNDRMLSNNAGVTWASAVEIPMFSVQTSAIPEPSTTALLAGAGGLVIAIIARSRRSRNGTA